MNLIGAASSAGAATMIVLSSAPYSSSVCASATTVDMRWPIATYTDTTSVSLLLMIVSIAIAVLPVWRSPMISSRWPRPIGIIASIAFSPVCIGCLTGWRWTTPGALNSAGRVCARVDLALAVERAPERVDDPSEQALADGDLQQLAGALDGVALGDVLPLAEQHRADVVGLEVQREAGDAVGQLEHLERHAVLQAVQARDAVGHRQHGAHLGQLGRSASSPSMRLFRMLVISSGLICMSFP